MGGPSLYQLRVETCYNCTVERDVKSLGIGNVRLERIFAFLGLRSSIRQRTYWDVLNKRLLVRF